MTRRRRGLWLIEEAWSALDQGERPGILLSYPFHEREDMEALLAPVRAAGVRVFADSGAFSAWQSGKVIDLAAYAAWLHRWGRLFDLYANLDVIGDAVATATNQTALEDQGLKPLPTVHFGAPWSAFDAALAAEPPYMGFGGLVGRMTFEHKEAMRWCLAGLRRTAAAGAKVHGFGVTRWNAIWDLPWQSVDSTSWKSGGRYGAILLFTGTKLIHVPVTKLTENIAAIRASGYGLHEAYEGITTAKVRTAYVMGLRSTALAQAAIRRRHQRPDFTIYCSAIL